jgi:hypothetical protein
VASTSDNPEHIKQLIAAKTQRLEKLEVKQARLGFNSQAEVDSEIEDLHKEIAALQARIKPVSSPKARDWPYRSGPLLGLYVYILTDNLKAGRTLQNIAYGAGAAGVHTELGLKQVKDSFNQLLPHVILIRHRTLDSAVLSTMDWMFQQPHLQHTIRIAVVDELPAISIPQNWNVYLVVDHETQVDQFYELLEKLTTNRPKISYARVDMQTKKYSVPMVYYDIGVLQALHMMMSLSFKNVNIEIFLNGNDVLEYCKYKTVPLVFLNHQSYGIDWKDLVNQIKELNPETRIILIHAGYLPEGRKQLESLGIDYDISIPVVMDDAEMIFRDVLGEDFNE